MKNVLIITGSQIQYDIRTLCYGQGREVNFPAMITSNRFWVFDRDYIRGKFSKQLKEFKSTVRAETKELGYQKATADYIPGSGMCDRFTAMGVDGLNRALYPIMGNGKITHEGYKQQFGIENRLGDLVAGAGDIRFTIPAGENVNGVTDAGHSAMWVATTEDGRNVYYEIFEMQNEQSTPLHVARRSNAVVFDFIM